MTDEQAKALEHARVLGAELHSIVAEKPDDTTYLIPGDLARLLLAFMAGVVEAAEGRARS